MADPVRSGIATPTRSSSPRGIHPAEGVKYLAKSGFSQSYGYFTWRTTKEGPTEYFTELTQTEVAEYMRPNLFANTPDILHESLQHGGRPAFQARLVLAATLGRPTASTARRSSTATAPRFAPGRRNTSTPRNTSAATGTLMNPERSGTSSTGSDTIRRDNPALHFDRNLRFFNINNSS